MKNKTVIIDDWDRIFPFTTAAFSEMNERRKAEGWSLIDVTEKEGPEGTVYEYHWQKEIIHNEERHKQMFNEVFGAMRPSTSEPDTDS